MDDKISCHSQQLAKESLAMLHKSSEKLETRYLTASVYQFMKKLDRCLIHKATMDTQQNVDGVDHETLLNKEPQYGIPAESQPAAFKVVDL